LAVISTQTSLGSFDFSDFASLLPSEADSRVASLLPSDVAAQGGYGIGDELNGQSVEVRPLPVAIVVQLVEGLGCHARGDQAQHHAGERVRHVELCGVGGVGHDHVAAEHRHRQATQGVGLTQ
jgi:hypothetical protein